MCLNLIMKGFPITRIISIILKIKIKTLRILINKIKSTERPLKRAPLRYDRLRPSCTSCVECSTTRTWRVGTAVVGVHRTMTQRTALVTIISTSGAWWVRMVRKIVTLRPNRRTGSCTTQWWGITRIRRRCCSRVSDGRQFDSVCSAHRGCSSIVGILDASASETSMNFCRPWRLSVEC